MWRWAWNFERVTCNLGDMTLYSSWWWWQKYWALLTSLGFMMVMVEILNMSGSHFNSNRWMDWGFLLIVVFLCFLCWLGQFLVYHVEIPTDVSICWNSSCTHHWMFQQAVMVQPCFTFSIHYHLLFNLPTQPNYIYIRKGFVNCDDDSVLQLKTASLVYMTWSE